MYKLLPSLENPALPSAMTFTVIELAAASLFPENDLPREIRYRVTEPDSVREALDRGRLWVATTEEEKTIGFAMAGVVDDQAYLEEVDVLPQYGGRGVGTRLVQTVIGWAQSQSFDQLLLLTFRHLPWNAPFYESLGFTAVHPSEHGPEIRGLIEEEAAIGINVADRVVMRYAC